jgi:hypothetical protein
MHRRDFLKTGVQAAMVGAAVSVPARPDAVVAGEACATRSANVPAVLASYTAEDHRRRLQNIAFCHRAIRGCMRKHLVTNYLPGQCAFNLCEYPARERWSPGEQDEQILDRLKDQGIQLIQVMDDWNDQMGLFGGHKLDALNPEGFRRFVAMVHQRGMKILAYVSSGYFTRTDPHFREEWCRPGHFFHGGYWNMGRCSPASPGWRAYLLPHVARILDEYGVDGLYNDWGYVPNMWKGSNDPLAKDEVPAFKETPEYDGAAADLAQLIYDEVKRRGGIVKFHCDQTLRPMVGDAKVYDYLWVGEGVSGIDSLRDATKNHPPYVVPCTQFPYVKLTSGDEPFVHAIPYLQFPLLEGGRPYTGERAVIPGVKYAPDRDDKKPVDDMTDWFRRNEAKWKYYQAHPNGPYMYSEWGPVPPQADYQERHARWLKQYMPLVEAGTWAWLEIGDSALFAQPLPAGIVASAFANRETYLVLANYASAAAEITTAEKFVPLGKKIGEPAKQWSLAPRTLQILRRVA